MGGDLRHLDAPTLALLTNREVLAVNQASTDNAPLFLDDGTKVWTARADGGDRYVALFNVSDKEREVSVALSLLGLGGKATVRDLWEGKDLGQVEGRVSARLASHGAGLFRVKSI
jgi:hypothetical protein